MYVQFEQLFPCFQQRYIFLMCAFISTVRTCNHVIFDHEHFFLDAVYSILLFFLMILSRNIILCNIIFGLCETRTVLLYGIIKVCIWKQIDFSRASYVVFRLFIIAFVHYIQSILWVSLFSFLVQFYLKLVSIWRYLFS